MAFIVDLSKLVIWGPGYAMGNGDNSAVLMNWMCY